MEKKMNSARGCWEIWELNAPFPAAVQWELPFLATVFSSFIPSSLAKSDEGKEVKIYAGPKGASDSMQASIPWFFERLWLGTCSLHVMEPPSSFAQ
ncbi:unnamed protein product [Prunus armeniaca]